MRNFSRLFLLIFLFVSANAGVSALAENLPLNHAKVTLEGGDGSSKTQALIVKYNGNYNQSINQEIQWLEGKFGNQDSSWQITDKHTVKYLPSNRIQDILTIKVLVSGEEKKYYFDITDPFIKLAQKITSG